jgi:hypothetical protein
MSIRYALPAAALLLTGCGGDAGTATTNTTAATTTSGSRTEVPFTGAIKAGRWKVVSSSAGIDPQEDHLCVSPEQAASGSFMRGELPEGCTTERDNIGGGTIDFAMTCRGGSQAMSSSMTGNYTTSTYQADITLVMGGTTTRASSKGVHESDTCQAGDTRIQS